MASYLRCYQRSSGRAQGVRPLFKLKDVLPSSFRVAPFTSREYSTNLTHAESLLQGIREKFHQPVGMIAGIPVR